VTDDYEAFRSRVVAADRGFQADLDPAHLVEIASLLTALPVDDAPRDRIRYTFSGWAARGIRILRPRPAERGFGVRVRRHPRAEFGLRGRLLRHGYRIEAVGPVDAAPYSPRFADARGEAVSMTPSNEVVARQLALVYDADGDCSADGRACYVDSIRAAPAPSDEDRGTWLAALVCEEPEALWDFAQSEQGAPWRERLVAALDRSPVDDRWSDRYRLTAYGLAMAFRSDLEPLSVVQPNPPLAHPAEPLRLAALEPRGVLLEPTGAERDLPAPSAEWLEIEDASVQDGGTVTAGEALVVYEASAHPALDFVSGTWLTTFGSRAHPEGALLRRAPAREGTIAEGILLAGRNDFNWFHWMVEYLPRVLRVPPSIPPQVPVIVTGRTPPTGLEALRALTDRPILEIDPEASHRVDLLHVASPVVQVLDTVRVPWVDGLGVDLPALVSLRARLGVDSSGPAPERALFLERRSGHRGITNESELARAAADRGLEVVDPSALSFSEQLELFSSARVVVGASGAVMANYLLLRPGAHVLALTSEQLADFVLPVALATVSGCSFAYLTGPSTAGRRRAADRNDWVHSNFRIDTRRFHVALDELLAR